MRLSAYLDIVCEQCLQYDTALPHATGWVDRRRWDWWMGWVDGRRWEEWIGWEKMGGGDGVGGGRDEMGGEEGGNGRVVDFWGRM
jgi:hypothetical protein